MHRIITGIHLKKYNKRKHDYTQGQQYWRMLTLLIAQKSKQEPHQCQTGYILLGTNIAVEYITYVLQTFKMIVRASMQLNVI